jgi:3-hydroxyisobutyrate dehydrogenase
MNIGFIGTGVMGGPIALHLSQMHRVTVYNRSTMKALRLGNGVKVVKTIAAAMIDQDIVFTMVGTPDDVRQIYRPFIPKLKPGTICVDLTTSSPTLAIELYRLGKQYGIHILDAPVTGGEKGAKEKTLTIMVGGDEVIFHKVKPLFEIFSKSILYLGESGQGQHAKMANQIAISGALVSLAEALTYAKNKNLNLDQVLIQ